MWYTYKINDSGKTVLSKAFEKKEDAIRHACKTPKEATFISNTEPDLLGRAYSDDPKFNATNPSAA